VQPWTCLVSCLSSCSADVSAAACHCGQCKGLFQGLTYYPIWFWLRFCFMVCLYPLLSFSLNRLHSFLSVLYAYLVLAEVLLNGQSSSTPPFYLVLQMLELLLAIVGSARLGKLVRPWVNQMAYTSIAYMQVCTCRRSWSCVLELLCVCVCACACVCLQLFMHVLVLISVCVCTCTYTCPPP
jgi:hypothetical protein